MRVFRKLFAIATVAVVLVSCANSKGGSKNSSDELPDKQAKYVFYFIGDGMAAPQVRLAEAALTTDLFQQNYAKLTGSEGTIDELNIKSLGVTGLATTNAKNRYITGSAAAATALATGHKTNIDMISVNPEGESLRTMAEMAKDNGMKVGIVSSVSLDHATPAGFYAHTINRNNYSDISDQMLETGFDYFAGGSVKWDKRAKSENTDKATAYESYKKRAAEKGFVYVTTKAEFDNVGKGFGKPVIATIDMLANEQYTGDGSALPYTIDLDKIESEDNKISLADFTRKGAELLENENGFFMMIEGGKIDWTCHANDAASCTYEVVAFDQAIGEALKFAAKHPDETLIVVTGDHDCGGLTLGFAGTGYESAFDVIGKSRTSYIAFSDVATEKIKNGESFDKLLEYACQQFGFTNDEKDGKDGLMIQSSELSDYEVSMLKDAFNKSKAKINKKNFRNDSEVYNHTYAGYDPFTTTCTHLLNVKSGVDFASYSHTALPVMVFADGANESIFNGYYDNTDIAKKIMLAAGLE